MNPEFKNKKRKGDDQWAILSPNNRHEVNIKEDNNKKTELENN